MCTYHRNHQLPVPQFDQWITPEATFGFGSTCTRSFSCPCLSTGPHGQAYRSHCNTAYYTAAAIQPGGPIACKHQGLNRSMLAMPCVSYSEMTATRTWFYPSPTIMEAKQEITSTSKQNDDKHVRELLEKYSAELDIATTATSPPRKLSQQEILDEIVTECERLVSPVVHCPTPPALLPTAMPSHHQSLPQCCIRQPFSLVSSESRRCWPLPEASTSSRQYGSNRQEASKPSKRGTPEEDEEEQRLQIRRERNRLAAQRYRQRRQDEHTLNQAALAEQRHRRRQLLTEIRRLEAEIEQLRNAPQMLTFLSF